MAKLSPVVFAQMARDFLCAAEREFQQARTVDVSIPAYFLVARSIELALKSFLLLRECTEGELRKISHNLDAALQAARKRGLDGIVTLSPAAVAAIQAVNAYYEVKDLEYVTTGFKSYPPKSELLMTCALLLDKLEPHLRQWRPTH